VSKVRLGALLLGLLLMLSGQLNSLSVSAAVGTVDAATVDDAIRFRSEFGLRSDVDFVQQSFEDPVAFPDNEWAVPLTRFETAELTRRLRVREAIASATEYAVAEASYAGIYIDQRNGGRPVFLFKGQLDVQREELASRIPAEIDFNVISVQRSFADLQDLRVRIEADKERLAAEGLNVTLTGLKPSANSVVVGIDDLTAEKAARMRAQFGDALLIREQEVPVADTHACTGISHCWPAKGGIKMYWALNSAVYCTTGWVARRSDTNALVLVTAGHCIELNGGSGDEWRHAGTKLGNALLETWAEGADADVGLITVTTAPATKNQVLTSLPNVVGQINAIRVSGLQLEGDALCRIGATSGRTCGTLTVYDITKPSCNSNRTVCKNIDHTNEVSFDSTGGDSGGPVFQFSPIPGYVIGYGTHVDSEVDGPGANGWYSAIGWGYTAYASYHPYTYAVCTTASC
jgi:hypothetical protein